MAQQISEARLHSLIRRLKQVDVRVQKQEAKLKAVRKSSSTEKRNLLKQVKEEKDAVLVQYLRKTGLPMDNIPLIIGIALEAKDFLENGDETARTDMINKYTARYLTFQESLAKAAQQEPDSTPSDSENEEASDPSSLSQADYYAEAEGMC